MKYLRRFLQVLSFFSLVFALAFLVLGGWCWYPWTIVPGVLIFLLFCCFQREVMDWCCGWMIDDENKNS